MTKAKYITKDRMLDVAEFLKLCYYWLLEHSENGEGSWEESYDSYTNK